MKNTAAQFQKICLMAHLHIQAGFLLPRMMNS